MFPEKGPLVTDEELVKMIQEENVIHSEEIRWHVSGSEFYGFVFLHGGTSEEAAIKFVHRDHANENRKIAQARGNRYFTKKMKRKSKLPGRGM